MKASKRSQSGFTLLELMIVLAIVAILSTVAYASYQDQIVRSRRAAAATCLQQAAQFVERYYSTSMTYVGAPNPQACDADVAAHYSAPAFAAVPTAKAFTLQIVPTGGQATQDTKCGTLSLTQTGERRKSGSATAASECW